MAKVLDARTGKELLTLKRDNTFTSVAWSPDGKELAIAEYPAEANI